MKEELKKLHLNLFPVLRWGRHYTLTMLVNDLLAGTTLASVALPQAMAYACI
jgi:MFS superfamily sulfate permease-like transporter